jgi:hypothetical protein
MSLENLEDTTAPVVIRAYSTGSQLKIITDEPAHCRFSFDGCNFNMSDLKADGTEGMSYSDNSKKTHYTGTYNSQNPKTYYIKCKDLTYPEAPNYPGGDPVEGGCTTTIKPFKVSGF